MNGDQQVHRYGRSELPKGFLEMLNKPLRRDIVSMRRVELLLVLLLCIPRLLQMRCWSKLIKSPWKDHITNIDIERVASATLLLASPGRRPRVPPLQLLATIPFGGRSQS